MSQNLAEFSEIQLILSNLHFYSKPFFQHLRNFGSFFQVLPKMAKINKKSLVNPMIFKFLSLEMFILGQKASKTTFHKKILNLEQKCQKGDFSKKKLHFEN